MAISYAPQNGLPRDLNEWFLEIYNESVTTDSRVASGSVNTSAADSKTTSNSTNLSVSDSRNESVSVVTDSRILSGSVNTSAADSKTVSNSTNLSVVSSDLSVAVSRIDSAH